MTIHTGKLVSITFTKPDYTHPDSTVNEENSIEALKGVYRQLHYNELVDNIPKDKEVINITPKPKQLTSNSSAQKDLSCPPGNGQVTRFRKHRQEIDHKSDHRL